MLKVAVTGANGFIGTQLCQVLLARPDLHLVKMGRINHDHYPHFVEIGTSNTEQTIRQLRDFDCIIHLAARAHTHGSSAQDFQRDNVTLSATLAVLARNADIKQFIYLSSIKVFGNTTKPGLPFSIADTPQPEDLYGQSKLASENAIKEIFRNSDTALTIVRPPLVWGPGCKGNLKALIKVINRGVPIPFGAINNRRDVISLSNLCDFLSQMIANPDAVNKTFLVSDGIARSSKQIVQLLEPYSQRQAVFVKMPDAVFKFLKKMPIINKIVASFFDNLEIDITETLSSTRWKPSK